MQRDSSFPFYSQPYDQSPLDKSPLMTSKTRKIDNNKLKLVCTMAIVNMSHDKLMEFSIEIIKKPPQNRIAEEIQVLIKATENMPYFKDLNKKNRHVRSNTHEKICAKIRYEQINKGMTVMHYGDPANKFYIILQGSVSIYVPRDYMVLQKEIEERKKSPHSPLIISVLQKIFQWRAKLKQFISEFPLEESPINRKAFKRLYTKASIQLSPSLIMHLTKDLKINHDYYYYHSIINLKRASMSNEIPKIDEAPNLNEDDWEENENASPSNNDEEDLENDYAAQKTLADRENMQEFLRGFNENERPILIKLQTYLGEVPLPYLDEPENYFQDGVFKFHFVGLFDAGNIFGEVGLLMRKPRSASVICNCDTDFAILTSEDYAEILEAVDRKEMESRMEFFIENLFQELQPEVAIRLSYMFKKSKFMKGNFIYKQSEKANDVFLVKKGEIQIYTKIKEIEPEKKAASVNEFIKTMYHKNENKVKQERFITIQLSNLGKGQSFGEEDIIYNRNRAYNAICCSNKVTLYYIPKSHFLRIITENKRIQVKIINNTKAKELWHRTQIENFYKKRQNNEEIKSFGNQAEIFPIRRDIKEIQGLNSPSKNIKMNSLPKNPKITIPKPILSYMTSPLCNSPLNSLSCSRVQSPKNNNKINNFINLQNILKPKRFTNNFVIRKENSNKTSEPNLNSSIVDIVKKNDKNLEELLKYSQNGNKTSKNNEFYKLLNEDEIKTNKMARIMYIYKSKRRNYSNSDLLNSNQKLTFKKIIQSFKKQNTLEDVEQFHPIRKFSYDFFTRRNSSIPDQQNKKITKIIEDTERKNSPVASMRKVAFSNRGNTFFNKQLNKKLSFGEPFKTSREKCNTTPQNNKFFTPFTARQIMFRKPLPEKKGNK